jgi:hypothetical protein
MPPKRPRHLGGDGVSDDDAPHRGRGHYLLAHSAILPPFDVRQVRTVGRSMAPRTPHDGGFVDGL